MIQALKILHVITSMDPSKGGVCKAVRDIIYGISLLDKKIVNEVVCLDNPSDEFLRKETFKIHALGVGKTPYSYNFNLYDWLKNNAYNFDKIIVHGLWKFQSWVVWNLWKKQKFEYFVMAHGMLDPYFQKARDRRFKALRNEIFWTFIEKKLINNASSLLFTCEEEKLLAKQTFNNYFPEKEKVVGLGIDKIPMFSEKMTIAFSEKVPGWNGKPFLLYLSRIHEKKGIDLLINAYTRLVESNPFLFEESEVLLPQLIIAGSLNTDFAKEMQHLANNFSNILFAGMLQDDAKWGAFYNSEAFMLPSHQENFGIAIVEAMACSKPVLITDKVNIWREIQKENAGIISDDTEEATLQSLSKWISLSFQEKQTMSKNAFIAYKKYFSIANSTQKFILSIL